MSTVNEWEQLYVVFWYTDRQGNQKNSGLVHPVTGVVFDAAGLNILLPNVRMITVKPGQSFSYDGRTYNCVCVYTENWRNLTSPLRLAELEPRKFSQA